MQVEAESDDKPVVDGEVLSVLGEDEVVLYWKESNSWKYIHDLASDGSDECSEVLAYYRSVYRSVDFYFHYLGVPPEAYTSDVTSIRNS